MKISGPGGDTGQNIDESSRKSSSQSATDSLKSEKSGNQRTKRAGNLLFHAGPVKARRWMLPEGGQKCRWLAYSGASDGRLGGALIGRGRGPVPASPYSDWARMAAAMPEASFWRYPASAIRWLSAAWLR